MPKGELHHDGHKSSPEQDALAAVAAPSPPGIRPLRLHGLLQELEPTPQESCLDFRKQPGVRRSTPRLCSPASREGGWLVTLWFYALPDVDGGAFAVVRLLVLIDGKYSMKCGVAL